MVSSLRWCGQVPEHGGELRPGPRGAGGADATGGAPPAAEEGPAQRRVHLQGYPRQQDHRARGRELRAGRLNSEPLRKKIN